MMQYSYFTPSGGAMYGGGMPVAYVPYPYMPMQAGVQTVSGNQEEYIKEYQLQQLKLQLQQLNAMKDNLNASLQNVMKSIAEVETNIQKLETQDSKNTPDASSTPKTAKK